MELRAQEQMANDNSEEGEQFKYLSEAVTEATQFTEAHMYVYFSSCPCRHLEIISQWIR